MKNTILLGATLPSLRVPLTKAALMEALLVSANLLLMPAPLLELFSTVLWIVRESLRTRAWLVSPALKTRKVRPRRGRDFTEQIKTLP